MQEFPYLPHDILVITFYKIHKVSFLINWCYMFSVQDMIYLMSIHFLSFILFFINLMILAVSVCKNMIIDLIHALCYEKFSNNIHQILVDLIEMISNSWIPYLSFFFGLVYTLFNLTAHLFSIYNVPSFIFNI